MSLSADEQACTHPTPNPPAGRTGRRAVDKHASSDNFLPVMIELAETSKCRNAAEFAKKANTFTSV